MPCGSSGRGAPPTRGRGTPVRHLTGLALALTAVAAMAQPVAPGFPDARASDPAALGWMQGFPPPPDKIIRFADDSFAAFPQRRWAFSNIRQLVPTRAVSRGLAAPVPLPRAERADLDSVRFQVMGSGQTMTWGEAFDANYTDGIVVLHRGRIVYERYSGVLRPDGQHLAASVTKSLVGTLGAMLVAEGVLDENAMAAKYVPEFAGTAFGDATVRELLDMTTSLRFSEDYTNPDADVFNHVRAAGFKPRPAGYSGPVGVYAFLLTLKKEGRHGDAFTYRTVNTDALGWVIARATGKSVGENLQERIWVKLGAEQDAAFTVDDFGIEFAGGGLNTGLRDLARFGETMRLGGRFNDRQIVPQAVVEDIRRGGDQVRFASAGYALLPGWSYRDMWWVTHNEHGAYSARGVHGQAVYIDPAAGMVIARYASHPLAANANLDPTSLPAYHALARYLRAHPR